MNIELRKKNMLHNKQPKQKLINWVESQINNRYKYRHDPRSNFGYEMDPKRDTVMFTTPNKESWIRRDTRGFITLLKWLRTEYNY